MMESKSLQEIGRHLKTLGLLDDSANEAMEEGQGFGGLLCSASRNIEKAKVHYKFHVIKNDLTDRFEISDYKAMIVKVPLIKHAVYGGVDTLELEKSLRELDWDLRKIPMPSDGEDLSSAFFALMHLAKIDNKDANTVAEQLMMKYWANTPVERLVNLCEDRSKYQVEMAFPVENSIDDIGVEQAYHLLDGRAIMRFKEVANEQPLVSWLTVEAGRFVSYPDYDLAEVLKDLPLKHPLDDIAGSEILLELAKGHRIGMVLNRRGELFNASMEADPRAKTLAVYDEMGNRLSLLRFGIKVSDHNTASRPATKRRRKGKGL